MIVVNRFRVPAQDSEGRPLDEEAFAAEVAAARDALAARPGYVEGVIARNVDEPDLWLLTTRWADVGSYRRALSAYDVKVSAVPLLSRAVDEPSAYEEVGAAGVAGLNDAAPRSLGSR